MNLVVIESPYAGDIEENVKYARRAMADSLARGEAPFASHLLYTQDGVLRDGIPEERTKGLAAGFAWAAAAPVRRFYVDRGISGGMVDGYKEAIRLGQRIEYCFLDATDWPLGECTNPFGHKIIVVPPHCPATTMTDG